jgi:dTDP-4-dehydrorhamnose reductase
MRIAVTGTQGQLVRCLMDQAASLTDITLVAIGRPALDLADGAAIEAAMAGAKPDIIINAAAYTAVDQAESEADIAFAVNRDGAANVARAAK